jgi:subtilisin
MSLLLSFAILTATASGRPLAAAPPETQNAEDWIDVIVTFVDKPGEAESALVRNAGGEIKHRFHLVRAIATRLPAQAAQALLRHPRVRGVEPDGRVFALDAELDEAWGVKRIGAGPVHQAGVRGTGIKVAVLDTGIDFNHPDLAANYHGGFDFVNNDAVPLDDNRHGTHVAGTIAARDNGAGVVGVAPEAHLYALKVLGADGTGLFSGVIAALQWAVDNGIQITNSSFGSSQDPGTALLEAYDNAAAAGILHIASAGNSGTCEGTEDNIGFPARFASVVAVAATDAEDRSPCFSSTGPDLEISAPGESIYSTIPGGGYQFLSGTSMAAPHVAGTAALLLDRGVTDLNGDGRVNDEVRDIMNSTAHDLGVPGRDTWFGFGLVDALAATGVTGARDPEVRVALTTNQTSYVKGTDASAGLIVVVRDEDNTAISGLPSEAFVTTFDGVARTVMFTETATPGEYTGALDIVATPIGSHAVNIVVTDDRSVSGSDSTTFFLNGALQVMSIGYKVPGGSGKHLSITLTINDETAAPVGNATVSISVSRNGAPYYSKTGFSNTAGVAAFELKNVPAGCYVTTVTYASATARVWDGASPFNRFCK